MSSSDLESEITPLLPNNSNDLNQEKPTKRQFFTGVVLVILTGCLFTSANVVQKLVCPDINFYTLFLFRGMVQCILTGFKIAYDKTSIFGPDRKSSINLALQAVFGGILLWGVFYAVEHVPLGNATAIFFCTPIATFIFAKYMLKERLALYRISIIVFMTIGVIFITRPQFLGFEQESNKENGTILGYVAAISVPFLSAVVSIWTRKCRKMSSMVVMFWFGVGCFAWAVLF